MKVRERIAFYLDSVEHPIGLTINLAILALILLPLGIFVAETYPVPEPDRFWLHSLDLGILMIFLGKYLLRFWCADHKIKFVFSWFSLERLLNL